MLDVHADAGDCVRARMPACQPPDRLPLPDNAAASPRDESPRLWDYALFLLEQQNGYCQLV
jgi:hypothetical protein